jgi:hypothetical protein
VCEVEKLASLVEAADAAPSARRRIWEVPTGYHCSIIGTCLPLDRGKKILRKTSALPRGRQTEYALHGAMVRVAQVDGPAARLFQKALDRSHAAAVARYGKLSTETALREAWLEDVDRGAIPGAYWAIMSHPRASSALLAEVFGDVHMLSHHVGRLNRKRLKRFDELSARAEALEAKLGEERRARALERAEHERAQSQLRAELEAARQEAEAWRARAAEPERLRELERARAARARELAKTERRLEHALGALGALQDAAQAADARAEPRAPPAAPAAEGACPAGLAEDERCPGCDLRGAVILYVGGERGMLPHLRRLAEARGSELIHHDGGREDGLSLLPRLCARADAVLCPVDRVGHVAMTEVKKACAQSQKAFIPLRRASLAAFGRGLEALAS